MSLLKKLSKKKDVNSRNGSPIVIIDDSVIEKIGALAAGMQPECPVEKCSHGKRSFSRWT